MDASQGCTPVISGLDDLPHQLFIMISIEDLRGGVQFNV